MLMKHKDWKVKLTINPASIVFVFLVYPMQISSKNCLAEVPKEAIKE